MYGNTAKLIEEVATGQIDAAFVTLPSDHPDVSFEEVHRDRLVACIRNDSHLATKPFLNLSDLQDHPPILHYPESPSEAHRKLLALLSDQGIAISDSSRATTPFEMFHLVREGYGIAFVREGSVLDAELTTRPIDGVFWAVTTSFIYHRQHCPKTIPLVLEMLRHSLSISNPLIPTSSTQTSAIPGKRPPQSEKQLPLQTNLFRSHF